MDELVFIPYNTPSSKNSKVKTARGLFHSKTVAKYLQNLGIKSFSSSKKSHENYKTRPNKFEALTADFSRIREVASKKPLVIAFHFVRDSRRKYDFHNGIQVLFDLMTAHGWIEDDDVYETYGIPLWMNGAWHTVDKTKPGCYVYVLSDEEVEHLKLI